MPRQDQEVNAVSGTQGVTGYRKLTDEEVALINECKDVAIRVGEIVSKVYAIPGVDLRWVAIGKTDLQKGFMSLIRGIAQPTTF